MGFILNKARWVKEILLQECVDARQRRSRDVKRDRELKRQVQLTLSEINLEAEFNLSSTLSATVPNYEFVSLLGKGATSSVLLVRDKSQDSMMALKVVSFERVLKGYLRGCSLPPPEAISKTILNEIKIIH